MEGENDLKPSLDVVDEAFKEGGAVGF